MMLEKIQIRDFTLQNQPGRMQMLELIMVEGTVKGISKEKDKQNGDYAEEEIIKNAIFLRSHLFAFVIVLFHVDGPDIVFGAVAGFYIVHCRHRRKHGMVHIIVSVHAVPANKVEILVGRDIILYLAEIVIGSEICRIGFLHSDEAAIQNIFPINDPNSCQLLYGEIYELGILLGPKGIPLIAKIFQSYPDSIGIRNHIRAPIVKDLNPAKFYIAFLYVYPGVRNYIVYRFIFCSIFYFYVFK